MKVEILKNKNGENFYPLSHTKSIYDDNGESLDDKLKEIEENINKSLNFKEVEW